MEIPTLTRAHLADSLYSRVGISYPEAIEIIDKVFSEIILAVKIDGFVKIHNFGSFNEKRKKGRMGRNPKTKEEHYIGPRNVVSFYPSNLLKEKINK